jgi:butyryl-CoA dehydrogenase
VTGKLIEMGRHDADRMLWHSNDYLTLVSILVIAWRWIEMAALANRGVAAGRDVDFYQGKLRAAKYWIRTELPRVAHLSELCEAAEDSYAEMSPEWF